MSLVSLSTRTRFILAAAGLACGLFVAAPVQAADSVFSFSLGNGGYIGRHFAPSQPAPQPVCMSENAMRAHLRAKGYQWISFGNTVGGWVRVTAQRMGQDFQFDMNRCTGAIANQIAPGGSGAGNRDAGANDGFGAAPAPDGFLDGFNSGFGGFR